MTDRDKNWYIVSTCDFAKYRLYMTLIHSMDFCKIYGFLQNLFLIIIIIIIVIIISILFGCQIDLFFIVLICQLTKKKKNVISRAARL